MANLNALRGASKIALVAALAAIGLSACNRSNPQAAASSAPDPLAAIPLADSGAPAPLTPAPVDADLPAAPAADVGQLADESDAYAFVDNAYAMNAAFADAPPDYAFGYSGERPWVWLGDDRFMRVAEPLPGGGWRYYYYEPGDQWPFLIRDADYCFGFQGGRLVAIYDREGRVMPADFLGREADLAGRILSRGEAIYQASQQQQREAVAEANWVAQRQAIEAQAAAWRQAQAADQAWQAYHAAHEAQEQAQWDAERFRREAEAARFDQSVNDAKDAQRDWQAAARTQTHLVQAPSGQSRQVAGAIAPKAPPPSLQPPSGHQQTLSAGAPTPPLRRGPVDAAAIAPVAGPTSPPPRGLTVHAAPLATPNPPPKVVVRPDQTRRMPIQPQVVAPTNTGRSTPIQTETHTRTQTQVQVETSRTPPPPRAVVRTQVVIKVPPPVVHTQVVVKTPPPPPPPPPRAVVRTQVVIKIPPPPVVHTQVVVKTPPPPPPPHTQNNHTSSSQPAAAH